MRQTPAQRSFMHKSAAQQQAQADAANVHGETVGEAFELMMMQLRQHRSDLKEIKSIEMKVDAKRKLLPLYDAYVDGVLQSRPGTQDQVIAYAMVWSLDAGLYARGIDIAEYMLAAGVNPPDDYRRNVATILQDEISTAVCDGKLVGDEALQTVRRVMEMTSAADTPDQPKARLCKAAGWALVGKTSTSDADIASLSPEVCEQALPYLQRAIELDKLVGVKKDIERLERRVKK
ncbi:terminase [Diaphorobacter sp. HDW4A]|uniref:phage terminase small subunit n=1 Tax=Diaphorobacter sp. HDW4A TaxID=2714924 RepID=UPI00140B29E5|nr:phage terminase small subunit [Diaphorobacter sp. HDW4A]QIL80829.1 terminase [Diaphorobacter sp. HDW4A]QIL83575.1 terminase [Diaphorobacter sp. HDW4A]